MSLQIESTSIDGNVVHITLSGRLDVAGTQAIDMKFTALAATRRAVVL